jgi:hypothetical protein
VSRSRHQGAAARRQTSQAGVTRARAAEMDNPGGCATPHAADGSARRQGRRAVCRTAKTRVEEGNRDICVSFGRRNASSADEGWLPDRSERCAPVVRASSPTFGGTLSMRTVIVNGIVRSPIARTCAPPCIPAMWCRGRLEARIVRIRNRPVLINRVRPTSPAACWSGRPGGAHPSGGMIRCARRVSKRSTNDLAESW